MRWSACTDESGRTVSSAPVGSAPPMRHEVRRSWSNARAGAVLGPCGATVGTGVDGAALLLHDRARVVVGTGEEIEAVVVVVGIGERLAGALGRPLVVPQRAEPLLGAAPVGVGHHQVGAATEGGRQLGVVHGRQLLHELVAVDQSRGRGVDDAVAVTR